MMARTLLSACLSVALLLCPSCGDPREAAVAAAFYDLENAMNWSDGATAVALHSADSITFYDGLLRHALTSDEETVKGLPPTAMSEVIMMRNRCERAEIEQMDGRAWIRHATDQGWYVYEEDPDRPKYAYEIGRIRVDTDGSRASAEVWWDGRRLKREIEYVYENDRWKRHIESEFAILDDELREWAHEIGGGDVIDMLLMWEASEWGELREDIWRPLQKRRR